MNDFFLIVELLFIAFISGLIGSLIGKRKGRSGAGFLFGFLIGPFGWLAVLLGPTADDSQRKQKSRQPADVLSEMPVAPQLTPSPPVKKITFPKKIPCPHCGGLMNERELYAGSHECPYCKKIIEVVTD